MSGKGSNVSSAKASSSRKPELVTLTSAAAHVLALPPAAVPPFAVVGADRMRRPFLQVRKSTAFYFTDEHRAAMKASPFYLGRDDFDADDPAIVINFQHADPCERQIFETPPGTELFWKLMSSTMWRTNYQAWRREWFNLRSIMPRTTDVKRAIEAANWLMDKYEWE